jgi:hypothetical protein
MRDYFEFGAMLTAEIEPGKILDSLYAEFTIAAR